MIFSDYLLLDKGGKEMSYGSILRKQEYVPIEQARIQSLIAFGLALLLVGGALVFGFFAGYITVEASGEYVVSDVPMMLGYYVVSLAAGVTVAVVLVFIAFLTVSKQVVGLKTPPLTVEQPQEQSSTGEPLIDGVGERREPILNDQVVAGVAALAAANGQAVDEEGSPEDFEEAEADADAR